MGLLNINRKRQEQKKPITSIKIGDWVTQYAAGYWQVVDIFPKYADEDYDRNGHSWKKGDRLGDWMILKKGFTPKMKPSNACDLVDAQWCKPISDEMMRSITAAFAGNPKAKEKFDNTTKMPKPSVASVWLTLSDEQAASFAEFLSALPKRFTVEEFWTWSDNYRQYLTDPSEATHILYLFSHLWEIDEDFQPLHFGPEIKKL